LGPRHSLKVTEEKMTSLSLPRIEPRFSGGQEDDKDKRSGTKEKNGVIEENKEGGV
jgi:hypothetical protein